MKDPFTEDFLEKTGRCFGETHPAYRNIVIVFVDFLNNQIDL